jgi:hypothetical protein
MCFPVSGLLHVVFHALERCLTELSEWRDFEVKLRAVTRIFGHKSYKDVSLKKLRGDMSQEQRALFASCSVQLLESLEDVAGWWVEAYPLLQDGRWQPDLLVLRVFGCLLQALRAADSLC